MEIIIFPLSLLNCILFVSILILLALHHALYTFLLSKLLWEKVVGFFHTPPPACPFSLLLSCSSISTKEFFKNRTVKVRRGWVNQAVKTREGKGKVIPSWGPNLHYLCCSRHPGDMGVCSTVQRNNEFPRTLLKLVARNKIK